MRNSSPVRLIAALAVAGGLAAAAPAAHALPRQNVCGPGWYGDYSNDIAYAGYFQGLVDYYWNALDTTPDPGYTWQQLNNAIDNRDSYQRRADSLLRSCG
jgi:hypothetical protein